MAVLTEEGHRRLFHDHPETEDDVPDRLSARIEVDGKETRVPAWWLKARVSPVVEWEQGDHVVCHNCRLTAEMPRPVVSDADIGYTCSECNTELVHSP